MQLLNVRNYAIEIVAIDLYTQSVRHTQDEISTFLIATTFHALVKFTKSRFSPKKRPDCIE